MRIVLAGCALLLAASRTGVCPGPGWVAVVGLPVSAQAGRAQACPGAPGGEGPGYRVSRCAAATRSGRSETRSHRAQAGCSPGGPSRRSPAASAAIRRRRCRSQDTCGLAVAHPAHRLDRARREGLRGVRPAHRRERVQDDARLPHQRRVQSALSRLQPGGHAFLCRLRRPALHAARLLCLEERPALLLFHRRHAAGVLQGHPLHRAGQHHLQPPRPGRCRRSMRAAPSRRSSTPSPRRTTAIRPTTPAGCCPTIIR